MKNATLWIFVIAIGLAPAWASAAKIAEYNFNGNLNNGASALYSPLSQIGAPADLSGLSYNADGNNSNYLQVAPAVGGAPTFTVSVWVWTDTANQGTFKGIFSNNNSSGAPFSFQFDSHNGDFRMTSVGGGADIFGAVIPNQWNNLVLTKSPGDVGSIWYNGVQISADIGGNPGGLQQFRIGINRNSDHSFAGLIDRVQIWNTVENVPAIFAAGPGLNATIPEPSVALLSIISAASLLLRRRRA